MNPPVYPGSSHDPYHSEEQVALKDSNKSRLMIRFTREEINRLGYPVIVEQWDKCVGPHSYGRQRRMWLTEFTPEERKKAGALHRKFYNWYLRSGTPEEVILGMETYNFIGRLTQFFAVL